MIFPFIVYVNFSLDDMTLNICSIVSLLTKSPMKQRFLMDSLWMFIFTLKVLSSILVICSKLSPLNINLRASGVMANAGFFCLCIEVGDIFRY